MHIIIIFFRQGYRQGGGDNNSKSGNNRPKNTLKFENDFDFEQANTKFEEIRSQLAKLKVATEEVVKPEPVVAVKVRDVHIIYC